jgi:hypothetical protein
LIRRRYTYVLFSQAWHHLNGIIFGKSNALISWLLFFILCRVINT